MRHRFVSTAALAAAGILSGAVAASATPMTGSATHFAQSAALGSTLAKEAQLFPRRYYRRYAPYAVPPPAVVPPPVVGAPVIVVPPPRPASCGEYHYWNGEYCVDARYNRPYLGPKP